MLRKGYKYLLVSCLLAILPFVAVHAADESANQTAWGYVGNEGPEFWGQLNPAFVQCAVGRWQAPIDIPVLTKLPKATGSLTTHYQQQTKNQGNTIDHLLHAEHAVRLSFPAKAQEYVIWKHTRYKLNQFHFHSPSETLMNGQSYPLEIHFVNQTASGKAVVIAVFIQAGQANTQLQNLINYLPTDKSKHVAIPATKINIEELLPQNKSYVNFTGSLTTPPCEEGLQWMVMVNPITASPAQIHELRIAGDGNNARPVQALHHRPIVYIQEQ
jgi:carbonic anhydrase